MDRMQLRVLRLLMRGAARLSAASEAGTMLLDAGDKGVVAASRRTIEGLAHRGLIEIEAGSVSITPRAIVQLSAKTGSGEGGGGARHDVELAEVHMDGAPVMVAVNVAESPLGLLARRRGKDGRPFLDPAEWRAGERFRADYTRGQIMPRLGANWEASVSSGRRGINGIADLTDAALAARLRVDKAIDAIGPELSGVLVDICCFLKGLELVETERGWPVRSAKVMLKASLAALARHYEPEAGAGRRPAHALHWGAEGYRPSMRGVGDVLDPPG